jgi:hypothetical protein
LAIAFGDGLCQRVLVEVANEPFSCPALLAPVAGWQCDGVIVDNVPTFAIGSDVASAMDPDLACAWVIGHLAEISRPGERDVGGAFSECTDSIGDAVGSMPEPVAKFGVVLVGVARVGSRWADDPAWQEIWPVSAVVGVRHMPDQSMMEYLGRGTGGIVGVGGEISFSGACT